MVNDLCPTIIHKAGIDDCLMLLYLCGAMSYVCLQNVTP